MVRARKRPHNASNARFTTLNIIVELEVVPGNFVDEGTYSAKGGGEGG